MDSEPFVDYAALDSAIAAEAENPMVTKWLVVLEVVDEDGARQVSWMSSNETSQVDELGLVHYFEAAAKARIARDD